MNRRMLCIMALVMLCFSCTGAKGEWAFFSEQNLPASFLISAQAQACMPYDNTRTEELNQLLHHYAFQLTLYPDKKQSVLLSLLIENEEAFTLAKQDQLTWIPSLSQTAYSSEGSDFLAGDNVPDDEIYGIREESLHLFESADKILNALLKSFDSEFAKRKDTGNFGEYGKATQKWTLTIKDDHISAFVACIQQALETGDVGCDVLAGCQWSGKQTLTIWLDQADQAIKVIYNGKCGLPDDQRDVSLTWRRKRGETVADQATIKTPSVKGKNRDNLTLSRKSTVGQSGGQTISGTFSWDHKAGTLRNQRSGTIDLTDSQSQLTGAITLKQRLSGETEARQEMEIRLDLHREKALLNGKLAWSEKSEGKVFNAWTLEARQVSDVPGIPLPGQIVNVDMMTKEQKSTLRDSLTSAISTAMIRKTVLLPEADLGFLNRDLDNWPEIVRHAQ